MLQMLIGGLDLRNLIYMLQAHGTNDLMTGFSGPFFHTCGLLEEVGGRRCLCYEGECAVRLDSDESRDGNSRRDLSRPSIELLAEVHRLDATSTKSRSNGWRRRSLAGWNQDALAARSGANPSNNVTSKTS